MENQATNGEKIFCNTYNEESKTERTSKNQDEKDKTPLVVQRPTFCAPNAGCPGLIPGQETRPRLLYLKRSCMPQQRSKIPHAATKAQHRQINKYTVFKIQPELIQDESVSRSVVSHSLQPHGL